MRRMQIGVMGSMADSVLTESAIDTAKEVGVEIAKKNATLVFGFEGDYDSFSTVAAREAEENGGNTMAFVRGSSKLDLKEFNSLQIVTGQERGGGREFPLVLSCDAIICIGGGSGTLTEIAMAYQAGIPVVVLKNTGGWSDKLADTFLDDRNRMKIFSAKDVKEALEIVLDKVKNGGKTT
jgi:hypothetical protein